MCPADKMCAFIKGISQDMADLYDNKEKMHAVGQCASEELYLSWEDSVKAAMERYEIVIDRYKRGFYPRHIKPMEGFMKMNGELMDSLASISRKRKNKE